MNNKYSVDYANKTIRQLPDIGKPGEHANYYKEKKEYYNALFNATTYPCPTMPDSWRERETVTEGVDFKITQPFLELHAPKGTLVTPTIKNGVAQHGHDLDQKKIMEYLNEGVWYSLDRMDIGGWHTDVYLKEFPNVAFNSVNFYTSPIAIPIAELKQYIMNKYRKKPVVIEAMQYMREQNISSVQDFVGLSLLYDAYKNEYGIATLEGVSYFLSKHDWIIKDVNGEFYPCKPDIFEKTYDRVDDESTQEVKNEKPDEVFVRSEKEIRESLAEMERMAASAQRLIESGKVNDIPFLKEKFELWREKSKARASILKWVLGLPYLADLPPLTEHD